MAQQKQINFLHRFDIPKSKKITKKRLYDEILEEMNQLGWKANIDQNYVNIKYVIKQMHGRFECETKLEDVDGGIVARTTGQYVVNVGTALSMCAFCGLVGWFIGTKVQDEKSKPPKDQIIDVFNNVSIKLGLK